MTPSVRTLQGSKQKGFRGSTPLCPRGSNARGFSSTLCIIFTDDDSSSISAAVEGMKQRKNVFWQIIAYEQDVKSIKATIKNIRNTSVVTLSNYQSRTDEEISETLLKDYIVWKRKKMNFGKTLS
jgi:hypothetical protein